MILHKNHHYLLIITKHMNKNIALTISVVLLLVALVGLSLIFDKSNEEVFGEDTSKLDALETRIDALENGIQQVVTCQFGVDEAGEPVYNLCKNATQVFINQELARQNETTK